MIGYPAARRYVELVERLTGDTDLVPPGVLLEVDRPEWSVLKNEVPIVGWRTRAAVAGQFTACGIQSTSSERVLVITSTYIINQTAGVLVYRVGMVVIAPQDAASGNASRDLRRLSVASNTFDRAQVTQQLPSVQGLPVPPNSFVIVRENWILTPSSIGRSALIVE